jgi:hypothetical protein
VHLQKNAGKKLIGGGQDTMLVKEWTDRPLPKKAWNNSLVSMVCRSNILVAKGIFPYNFLYGKHLISSDTKTPDVDLYL